MEAEKEGKFLSRQFHPLIIDVLDMAKSHWSSDVFE